MGHYPCYVLLIEDNPGDAILVRESLEIINPFEFDMTVGLSLADGMELLRNRTFDVILLDLSLPDSQGLDTLKAVQATALHTPIIVLTGLSDDQTTTAAMAKGAQDYLVKDPGNYGVLYHSIRYSIERNGLTQKINGSSRRERSAALLPFDLPSLDPQRAGPRRLQSDLLEFSQSIFDAEPQKQTQQIDCNQIVEKILCHFQVEINQAGIEVLSSTLPLIRGNPFQITQLFQSLISEAIRRGSRTRDPLALSASDQKSHWLFTLAQGTGLLEDFGFPAVGTAMPPTTGSDDGYAWPSWSLCQKIVAEHGGTLGHRALPMGANLLWFTLAKSSESPR